MNYKSDYYIIKIIYDVKAAKVWQMQLQPTPFTYFPLTMHNAMLTIVFMLFKLKP